MSSTNRITALFRKEILAMSAYKVANAKGLIKLDAMENPYGWPEDFKENWLKALKECQLNRYPDPEARQLVDTIRRVNSIHDQFDILLGNGSDEIILLLLMALNPGASILAPDPTFVMYRQLSLSLGLNYIGIPLLAGSFELDLPAMLAAIEQYQPALIFLAYPNNPTGNLFDEQSIRAIIKASTGLVIIDEAYSPFAGASFLNKLDQFENLLVMRTLSKLGLAGLRLGYIVGDPVVIGELNKIRLPYNINCLTQESANYALSNHELFDSQTQNICAQRTILQNRLEQLDGVKVFVSAANFILFRTAANKASPLFEIIKQQGVLIKNMSPQGGLLTDCLRVTVGKPEENEAFLAALKTGLLALSKTA